ncbi:MAG: hypothetical protein MSC31_16940 [Solirubrobacteraceae bacterium MAG38_C4-C5]|nr:hypothetical protein [Candidatus Siliceabacter maunaloa]
MGRTWAALTAVVLASAAATAVVAPDWLDGPTRELPNDPRLMADIFFNNLLIVLLPLLGGWLAAGHRQAGRPRVAWIFVAVPTVVLMRSLLTIGAVGGADPAWLGAAARWWLLELGALAAATATGLWLVRHPHRREDHGPAMMRRALLIAVGALGCGTFIEVLTA